MTQAKASPGDTRLVPIDELRTTLSELRTGPCARSVSWEPLANLPLRVVKHADGFEVIDGFKRLARYRAQGVVQVPVVVETIDSGHEALCALLWANNPRRTLSAWDEAKIVLSLRQDFELGPKTIASLLGKKKSWVACRLLLARRLCDEAASNLAAGHLSITLAQALCTLAFGDQRRLLDAIIDHGLTNNEALALVKAIRSEDTDQARTTILADPLPFVRPQKPPETNPLEARIQEQLEHIRQALIEFQDFRLPEEGLEPAVRRKLEAAQRTVVHQLQLTAHQLGRKENKDGQEPTNPKTCSMY